MKKLLILITSIEIFLYQASNACLIYTNFNPLVVGGGFYKPVVTNAVLSGQNTFPGRTVVVRSSQNYPSQQSVNNPYGFRMSGTAYGASVHIGQVGSTKGIKFKVFRWNQMTNTTLDLVGESEMITSYVAGSNYFTFVNPITGIHEGDLTGIFLTNSPVPNTIWLNSGNGNSFFATGDITGISKTIATGGGGGAVLQFYMNPPVLAYVGDSIIAGHNCSDTNIQLGTNYWHPWLDVVPPISGRLFSSIPYDASTNGESLVNYCNYSQGSTTFDWVNTNAMTFITNDHALVLWIHTGVNDANKGILWPEILTNLASIRQKWPMTNALLISEIIPDTISSDAISANIRSFNTNINFWCGTNNATVVKQHDLFGQIRVSTGFLDDLANSYTSSVPPHLSQFGVSTYVSNANFYLKSVIVTQ